MKLVKCPKCRGQRWVTTRGLASRVHRRCETCQGRGKVPDPATSPSGR